MEIPRAFPPKTETRIRLDENATERVPQTESDIPGADIPSLDTRVSVVSSRSTIRSMGGHISDAQVECRTTRCGAIVMYQPAFFFLDERDIESELVELLGRFDVLGRLVEASPNFSGEVTAFGLAPISRAPLDGSQPRRSLWVLSSIWAARVLARTYDVRAA